MGEAEIPSRVGIVGLGLIGGSFAKAYADAGVEVYAVDTDERAISAASAEQTIVGTLSENNIGACQLILLCVYPQAIVEWVEQNCQFIAKDALVIDCGSVKRPVCPKCFAAAERCGFTFLGGHPMAGIQYSGYRHARADLYAGQPMVLVAPEIYDPAIIVRAENALSPAAFGSYSVTSADTHDQIIAYTSQLAHVVSSAYAKSPTAQRHKGFSAGSYRDLTRVAELNADMWSELFMHNADNLVVEIDCVVRELQRYREALASHNQSELHELLEEGTRAKRAADGRFSDARDGGLR